MPFITVTVILTWNDQNTKHKFWLRIKKMVNKKWGIYDDLAMRAIFVGAYLLASSEIQATAMFLSM